VVKLATVSMSCDLVGYHVNLQHGLVLQWAGKLELDVECGLVQ